MKILSGKHKGKTIFVSNDRKLHIRPTMSKIRMAIFNIIYSRIISSDLNDFFENAIILDLGCGYGSLGMEAISRGAKFCYFLDNNFYALSYVEKSLEKLGENSKAKLINANIQKLPIAEKACNLIFVDPPYLYEAAQITKIIKDLEVNNWLSDNAIITIETRINKNILYDISKFDVIVERAYGHTKILILQKICNPNMKQNLPQ